MAICKKTGKECPLAIVDSDSANLDGRRAIRTNDLLEKFRALAEGIIEEGNCDGPEESPKLDDGYVLTRCGNSNADAIGEMDDALGANIDMSIALINTDEEVIVDPELYAKYQASF